MPGLGVLVGPLNYCDCQKFVPSPAGVPKIGSNVLPVTKYEASWLLRSKAVCLDKRDQESNVTD